MATLQMGTRPYSHRREVPAPALDENGMLVFDGWPLKPGENE